MSEQIRTIGYICPKCGAQVMQNRSVFTLAAGSAEIVCPCGESVLHTQYSGEDYLLTVPCAVCGGTHTARCPEERMLRGATALACTETKQFCCFIGDEGTVERHLRELDLLLAKEKAGAEEAFSDNVIMYEILSELKEIAARPDGVTCACGSRRCGMEIRRSAVDLICRDCGARLRLSAATDRDLDDLCCHLKLVIPGRKEP